MKDACKHLFVAWIATLAAVSAGVANAQSSTSGCTGGHCQPHQVHVPVYHGHGYRRHRYGYRPYFYDPGFGTAEIIRAAAESTVLRAQARTQHLHADRLEMENSVEFLHTRLERKRINKASRFGHLHQRGELVRAERRAAQQLVAQPVERPMVDGETGRVNWPLLLRTSHYDKARQPIDTVFYQRSVNGSINPDHYLPMRDWIVMIECELKANVRVYEMEDYLEARKFLRCLLDEARKEVVPADAAMLAAN